MATVTANDADSPAPNRASDARLEASRAYDDRIVRMFATATIVWALLATLLGTFVAALLVVPEEMAGAPWLSFGRLRPLYTHIAIFAFAANALFAGVYYSTQRLCKTRMWSAALSQLHFWGWQLIVVLTAATLPLGIHQGRRLAELQWPIDVLFAVVWILAFGGNFMMTLRHRQVRPMYISLWFYLASIVTLSLLHVVNNWVMPLGWFEGISVYAGVQDAFVQAWYGHNAVAFLLTMPFLGLMYYFVPKAAQRPLYSYRLAIIQFWALVLLFVAAGPRYLHYSALPQWTTSLGMLFGLMLWMPLWGGLINGLMTLRGVWRRRPSPARDANDSVLHFFFVGLVIYGWITLEGSLRSITVLSAPTQYTDWMAAHFDATVLGWSGFLAFGMLYWLLPRLFQTPLWSPKLARIHYWTALLGIGTYVVPLYAAGLLQGTRWLAMDDTGNLAYPDFIVTLQKVVPLWGLSALGGAMYCSGIVMLAVNALQTWRSRPSSYTAPSYAIVAPAAPVDDPLPPPSRLQNAPVMELGKRLDVWSKLAWHRRWERSPARFTMLLSVAVVAVSLFELVPLFLFSGNVPPIATVEPYSPLELAGRQMFLSEGCYNCHSQMVRKLLPETKRYGEYSQAGELIYDRPSLWGERRIGPDLAREGGKRASAWHWDHLRDPRLVSPGSVMPHFGHLLQDDLEFDAIATYVQAAADLGVPYTDEQRSHAADLARWQAMEINADIVQQGGPAAVFEKQAIALIAYLQRLGTDLSRTPTSEATAESTADADAATADADAATADDTADTADTAAEAATAVGEPVP